MENTKYDLSDSEDEITSYQPPQKKPKKEKIELSQDSFRRVKACKQRLVNKQKTLLSLRRNLKKTEIQLDKDQIPGLFQIQKLPPRLPELLSPSSEFTDSWKKAVLKTEKRLLMLWHQELHKQSTRASVEFEKARKEANEELQENTKEGDKATQLLQILVDSAAKADHIRNHQNNRRRKQPKKA